MLGAGIPVEAMSDICHREFGHGRPLGDYSIPRRALVRGERFAAILRRVLGDRRAERTSMAWFGLSADLVAAEIVIHRRGPLWRAVHAGVSIPGLLPPMADNGRLLVDGGLLNNFPVDVMAATGEGPVLGVDVMGRVALARGGGPSITDVLGRSIVLASHERAVRTARLARWVITPRVPNGGFLDFRRLHVAVAAGRAAAERALMDMPDLMDPSTPSTGDRPVPGDPTRHQEGSST
jgi:predicted acylesterase/phospholipase RssA